MKNYYSHGKLLLTGEYLVLDGAIALAIPTKFGQNLTIQKNSSNKLHWKSLDENKQIWFEDLFKIQNNEVVSISDKNNPISNRLLQILNTAKNLNQDFLSDTKGYNITTQLEFPKYWGLGTSSTLINNIANWANVNPYQLLEITFGGSGYDIACAEADKSIRFQLTENENSHSDQNDKKQLVKYVDFDPSFNEHLYFVYLNQKQNSRDGIAQYRANTSDLTKDIETINTITQDMIECHTLDQFQKLMNHHEQVVSKVINQKPIKTQLFDDFDGSIKSLGAWGGDFVLVASKRNPTSYFNNKGFNTVITYNQMILK